MNYYLDWTIKRPKNIKEIKEEVKMVKKNEENTKYAEIFYEMDKSSNTVVGYDKEAKRFINIRRNKDKEHEEICLKDFLEICNK